MLSEKTVYFSDAYENVPRYLTLPEVGECETRHVVRREPHPDLAPQIEAETGVLSVG